MRPTHPQRVVDPVRLEAHDWQRRRAARAAERRASLDGDDGKAQLARRRRSEQLLRQLDAAHLCGGV